MPRHFERNAMLRIHLGRLAVAQAKECGIKALYVFDIAPGRQLFVLWPIDRCGAHGMNATLQQALEFGRAGSTRKTAPQPDDGNQCGVVPLIMRSEERRVGQECVRRVALGGRRTLKKKKKTTKIK